MYRNTALFSFAMLTAAVHLPQQAGAQDSGFITGRLSMSSTSSPDSDVTTSATTIGPAAGYFITDRIVVGLGLDYSSNTITNEENAGGPPVELERKTRLFTVNPYARFMMDVDDDLSMYAELSVDIGGGKSIDEFLVLNNNNVYVVEETESGVSTFSVSFGPGVWFKLSPRWAVNSSWGALRYESTTNDPEIGDEFTTNRFSFGITPASLSFGLNWLF